ncbi:family 16 glycosylhydrolase [Rubellimicrobium rubrum]|uniref:family 16 glycosylhydrolase n=1 Tax=Rubellimicrobium rubrum TaxID=2585369 RepID=UPI00159BD275|nr:family 16 glycosylhydrolase [Rubellimicrobium rubrum]
MTDFPRPVCPALPPRPAKTAVLASILLALFGPLPLVAQDAPSTQAFREDFSAPLDPARWYVSDGWSNGGWMACTWASRMVDVTDGVLRLTLSPAEAGSEDWLCAEVQTQARYHYGTYEARIRTDEGSGVNAAFFTYIGPVHEQPHDEIDVEILTRDTGSFDVNTYKDGEPHYGATVPLRISSNSDFHTYSFVWEPDKIRWFVDGELVHTAAGPDLPQTPQKIYLSHWNSRTLTDWMGPFVDPQRPLVMQVDWLSYTPPDQDCQFEASLLCQPGWQN